MALFARALHELGDHVRDAHGGAFLALARAGDGSAVALAEQPRGAADAGATSRPTTAREVPFFKRAQLAAADLHLPGPRARRRPRAR